MIAATPSSVAARRNFPCIRSTPETRSPLAPWQAAQVLLYRRPPSSRSAGVKECCASSAPQNTSNVASSFISWFLPQPEGVQRIAGLHTDVLFAVDLVAHGAGRD